MRTLVFLLFVAGVIGCGSKPDQPEPNVQVVNPNPTPQPQPKNTEPTKVFDIPVVPLWHKDDPNWSGGVTGWGTVVTTPKGKITRRIFNSGETDDQKAKLRYYAFLTRIEEQFKDLDVTRHAVAKGGIRVLGGGATYYAYDAPKLQRHGVFRVMLTRFEPFDDDEVKLVLAIRDEPAWREVREFVAESKDRSQAFVVVGIEEEGW